MQTIARRLEREYPETNTGWSVSVTPQPEAFVERFQTSLFLLLGACGFVLLIACANIANLLLARAASRRKELAIRSAVGGGRARLIRQLVTESLVLGALGGARGILLSAWTTELPENLVTHIQVQRMKPFAVDGSVLTLTLAVTLATGVFAALALGARRSHIFRLVLGQAMRLVLTGVALGLAGAYVLGRVLTGVVSGIEPSDPAVFGSVSLALIFVALLAGSMPVRRATRIDPVEALRHE